jgi:putative ABC transport system permease protein
MAILKVLGFDKVKILTLVLGEGVLLGLVGGLIGGGFTQAIVYTVGGIPMGEGAPFYVSGHAWWWGPAIGAATALLAGIIPAWNACSVKVSEVFAKVA